MCVYFVACMGVGETNTRERERQRERKHCCWRDLCGHTCYWGMAAAAARRECAKLPASRSRFQCGGRGAVSPLERERSSRDVGAFATGCHALTRAHSQPGACVGTIGDFSWRWVLSGECTPGAPINRSVAKTWTLQTQNSKNTSRKRSKQPDRCRRRCLTRKRTTEFAVCLPGRRHTQAQVKETLTKRGIAQQQRAMGRSTIRYRR